MTLTRFLAFMLVALLACGTVACDGKSLEDKAGDALGGAKDAMGDLSLDGLKKKFNDLGIADIESKAKEMGKLDLPAVKALLTEKLNVEKLMGSINTDNMAGKLKELAPKIDNLGDLVKKAKAALGM